MTTDSATQGPVEPPIVHGGNPSAARRLFPGAPQPLIDLSTGINPYAYPVPPLSPQAFTRLPEPDTLARLEALAAERYGAPSAAHVVAAPGTQILLPLIAAMVPAPGPARVLGPTYAEHLRAARLAGHDGQEITSLAALSGAGLAVVVNPNNPDGRLLPRTVLVELAREMTRQGGLLVVDEAFADVAPDGTSLAGDVDGGALVVLRSFGKFHGLAGVRLGFAVTTPRRAEWLRARLGPWAVSGPAIAVAMPALADRTWAASMRDRLAECAARLDRLLQAAGLFAKGGTTLFRLVHGPDDLFHRLGQAGIVVRRFPERPGLFRLGLPGDEAEWARLQEALLCPGNRAPLPSAKDD